MKSLHWITSSQLKNQKLQTWKIATMHLRASTATCGGAIGDSASGPLFLGRLVFLVLREPAVLPVHPALLVQWGTPVHGV